jgi:hypothetical protein
MDGFVGVAAAKLSISKIDLPLTKMKAGLSHRIYRFSFGSSGFARFFRGFDFPPWVARWYIF